MLWTDDVTPPNGRLICVRITSNSTVDNHVLAARFGMAEVAPDRPRVVRTAPRAVDLKRSRNKKISKPMQTANVSISHKESQLTAHEHSIRVVKADHFRRVSLKVEFQGSDDVVVRERYETPAVWRCSAPRTAAS